MDNLLELIITNIHMLMSGLNEVDKINCLNKLKFEMHKLSPFKCHPIDCVLWVPVSDVDGNDYNPNHVAPPELKLLYKSLISDGFTQPVVVWEDCENHYIVVDGFHRTSLVARKKQLREKTVGYLPVTRIVNDKTRNHRMAVTIRHNRARGQHHIRAMSDIVQELCRLGWKDSEICTELGMDQDEVLRLKQISGLMEIFHDCEFSPGWTVR
ncbi:IbrB-like domain-containing protein [Citrobacter koseri]|uniref:IbrB-like domain-containing protein n=1 Tax=Citrobacter koseri TaxID=545 RepID=UPI0028BE2547|nr:ParB/RepB/Spo0J family partition protein [Citrobacter koseri]MDT7487299.1 ParB/RepB/Spo0J family partition protein [Citrobacter koseri]